MLLLRIALVLALASAAMAATPLVDRARAWGVDFVHRSGPSLKFNAEVIGPGVALPDVDGDGRVDLYLVNGGVVDEERPADRLYRGRPGGFDDVTEVSGIRGAGIGNGALGSDLDNDGYVDLLLTGYAESLLWRNNGDGTFSEVTRAHGIPAFSFAATAACGDVDRDGHLDLYVASYIDFDYRSTMPPRVVPSTGRHIIDTLGPQVYQGRANHYLRGRGGRFEDATFETGAGNNEQGRSKSLGAVIADFDQDGWPEIVVANDQAPLAYYKTRTRPFLEHAARSYLNDARGNMGLATGDYDADGALDLFVTHFDHEHNALYRGGRGRFREASLRTGLSTHDWDTVGWGAAWVDLDADGWLDLVVANGHLFPPVIDPKIPLPERLAPIPQRMHVYLSRAGKSFELVNAGLAPTQGRGLAVGDLDADGAPDVALAVNNGPAQLLRNEAAAPGRCAVLDLLGTRSNRSGVGARVEALVPRLTRMVLGGNGYLSSDAASVYLGLGGATGPVPVTVAWPSGARQLLSVRPGERLRVVEPY